MKMWIVSVSLLFALTSLLILGVAQSTRSDASALPWHLPRVAHGYIYIVGTLSGFTVASSTFLAGFVERTSSPFLVTVIGMFLIAFLIFVGTAMILATVPDTSPDQDFDNHSLQLQRSIYILGSCSFYLGISLSWFALRPLLIALDLLFLADLFIWLLLFSGLAGASRLSLNLYLLSTHTRRTCIILPLLGFGAAALYGFGVVRWFPSLWPSEHAPLLFAVIVFALAGAGFIFDTLLLGDGADSRLRGKLVDKKGRVLLVYVQAVIVAAGLAWVSIVAPT